ncbi:ATP-binding protein, partial [Candidatus Micrarchaeota archaeon]|nr:ATP-binding protein [Candidatus Micrarchaeota archaeon]
KPIIIIGTTNIPNELDPALLRPGRFDKIIYMPLPDLDARKAIFQVHLRKYSKGAVDVIGDIDYDLLAKKTERYSGADIKNIVDEALKAAAKKTAQLGNTSLDNLAGMRIVQLTTDDLLKIIKSTKPSVGLASIEDYDKFKMDFERRTGAPERKQEEKEKGIRWEDVAGLEGVKEALLESIQLPLSHEDLMKEYGVKPSKGILLYGPPGCGKTLIAKAAANELDASFISLSGAELMKKGFSQAASVIKETFLRGRENTPSIIFLDEIETVAPSRDLSGGDVIGQLLNEMDGIKELKGVVVIGATNKPAMLDSAILRPGRFDKMFLIAPPNKEERKQIFKINLGAFAEGIDLDKIAEMTEMFSGADITSIVQSAKMRLLRKKIKGETKKITTSALVEIISKRRPSITSSMLSEYDAFKEEYGERQ